MLRSSNSSCYFFCKLSDASFFLHFYFYHFIVYGVISKSYYYTILSVILIVTPIVKGEVEKKPTKVFEFLQSLMPQLVPEGKPCTLEAKVTMDPKPVSIKWYFIIIILLENTVLFHRAFVFIKKCQVQFGLQNLRFITK